MDPKELRPSTMLDKVPTTKSLQGFTFKTKPYKHQLIAWDRLRNSDGRHAMLMEMGTGKTKVVIDWLAWRVYRAEPTGLGLFIAPNSLLEKEADEFEKHFSGVENQIEYTTYILRGDRAKKIKLAKYAAQYRADGLQVIIAGYETVRTLAKELEALRPEIVICDESTRIKSGRAQQSKAIHRIGTTAKYRIIMTGTPITQSPVDIWSQYKFLRPQIFGTSFLAFRARYCIMGGYQGREIVKYTNLDDLSKKVFSIATRFTKDECLDLPDKIRKVYRYELPKAQRKMYDDFKEDLCAELAGKKIIAAHILPRMIRFQQLCSGFLTTGQADGETIQHSFEDNPKFALMQEIIRENGITKAVIWCRYLHEIALLEQYFQKNGYVVYALQGSVAGKLRQPMINAFNANTGRCMFIGQIRTGGLGIDLVGADKVFYMSNSWSLEDRLQSEDRCHRIGQTKKVLYFDLIGKNTIEETILRCLEKKQGIADIVHGEESVKIMLEG